MGRFVGFLQNAIYLQITIMYVLNLNVSYGPLHKTSDKKVLVQ